FLSVSLPVALYLYLSLSVCLSVSVCVCVEVRGQCSESSVAIHLVFRGSTTNSASLVARIASSGDLAVFTTAQCCLETHELYWILGRSWGL
ncbi:hypothetical protein SGI36_21485, partial [Providencia rettgeri]